MMASIHTDRICTSINKQLVGILDSTAFKDWDKRDQLKIGDLIVVNNSFLRREGDATKNSKYLCLNVDPDGEPAILLSPKRINVKFLRIPLARVGQYDLTGLRQAAEEELSQLGSIVFALVGEIGEDEPTAVRLPSTKIKDLEYLRFEPLQDRLAFLDNSAICINRLDDIDVVWKAVFRVLSDVDSPDLDGLADCFERSFSDLREAAGRPVNISRIRPDAPSILSEVVVGIQDQIAAYDQALEAHLADAKDTEALNEVMRIAYNFADGAGDLITLIIGLSDLKPILLWLTVSAQADLAERFACLPFALTGRSKPSLERYKTIVGGARNRAFHDLFAFGRPFRVPLEGNAFRAAQLRLFREHRRVGPALEYQDRELVQLMEGFTRAAERPVPLGFWEKNSEVMHAVAAVAVALREALLMTADAIGRQM